MTVHFKPEAPPPPQQPSPAPQTKEEEMKQLYPKINPSSGGTVPTANSDDDSAMSISSDKTEQKSIDKSTEMEELYPKTAIIPTSIRVCSPVPFSGCVAAATATTRQVNSLPHFDQNPNPANTEMEEGKPKSLMQIQPLAEVHPFSDTLK